MSVSGPENGEPKGDLGDRISAARSARKTDLRVNTGDKYNQITLAWRMTIELVVGTAMGFGIGWGLDSLFGLKPLFMIIFGLLGFAAGVKTVIGTAKEVSRRAERSAHRNDATGASPRD